VLLIAIPFIVIYLKKQQLVARYHVKN
ncbi:MAG TPA: multidrug ABC transporter permease, partial [Leuconostoc pseudomesenteroides]|nr:multidrug ABC transporter permease [Leuconostoc pseudomesenteroides]